MSGLQAECAAAGLDERKVTALASRLARAARDARKMGLTVFGGSGAGSLRWRKPGETNPRLAPLVVAHIDGFNFDGGDGAEHQDEDGLWRGEDG